MKPRLLGIACIAVLCVILDLGLWPFHAPKNEVAWLGDRIGLRFGDNGTVISSGTFQVAGSPDETSCTIQIWLQPARTNDSGTILAFYSPDNPLRLSLHQSLTDLMLQVGMASQQHWARKQKIYVDDVFRRTRPVFVTITSGAQGTAVYVDGTLARTAQQFRLTATDCTGWLVLGGSSRQPDTWSGQVRGLAIYYSELPARAVLRNYNAWTKNGQVQVARTNAMQDSTSSTSAPVPWHITAPVPASICLFHLLSLSWIRSFSSLSGTSSICPGAIGKASSRTSSDSSL